MLRLLLAVMVLSWAGNFVMAKVGLREIPPFALVTLRLWLATALLVGIYLAKGRHRQMRLQRKDWWTLGGLGFLGVTMNQAGFVIGMNYTTVGHASLIIGMGPLLVLLMTVYLGMEKFTLRKGLGMSLAFSGAVLLASEHGFRASNPALLGDLIVLSGAIAFSAYTVFSKRVAKRYDTLTLNTGSYLTGTILATPLTGWQLWQVDWPEVGWQGWAGVLYLAVIGSVVAYTIFYYALTKIDASRVSALTYLQPVLATLLAVVFLGETVSRYLVGGGTLILLGVYLAERGNSVRRQPTDYPAGD